MALFTVGPLFFEEMGFVIHVSVLPKPNTMEVFYVTRPFKDLTACMPDKMNFVQDGASQHIAKSVI